MPDKGVAPGVCIRQSFPLFEQLAQASHGWELDFRQLSANSNPYRLEQLSTARMLYSRVYFDSHFHQLGGPVLGFRTFALHTDNGSDFRWCGEAVNRHSLIVLPADGEFESVSPPGFDVFTVSLSNALLERTAELQFQRPLSAFMGSRGEVCHLAGGKLRELRALLHRLSRGIERFGGASTSPHSAARLSLMELNLAQLVLACLDRGEARAPRAPRSKRLQTMAKVMELIERRPLHNLRVPDLVAQAGVSRRTLEHAFQDSMGVSPAAYLKATRLKALNQELLTCCGEQASVAGLLRRFGFAHPGQAAADYRAMFGELPSATLRRVD